MRLNLFKRKNMKLHYRFRAYDNKKYELEMSIPLEKLSFLKKFVAFEKINDSKQLYEEKLLSNKSFQRFFEDCIKDSKFDRIILSQEIDGISYDKEKDLVKIKIVGLYD